MDGAMDSPGHNGVNEVFGASMNGREEPRDLDRSRDASLDELTDG